MDDIDSWIRPVLSGFAGAILVWFVASMTKHVSRREGNVRVLAYSLPFKLLAVLLIPFAFFLLYAVSQSYQGQEIPAFLVASGVVLAAVFFPYQVFFVKFSYDDKNVYYQSPLAGSKRESWENLTDVGYSALLQADYIVMEDIGKIWCSNMLNGYAELGEFLEKKVQELYPEEEN